MAQVTATSGGGGSGGNATSGGGVEFSVASDLRNLPQNTSSQLQGITNQSSLRSHLDVLSQLIEDPSGFSKVTTYPRGNFAIYYYLSPKHLDLNDEPYALLMLRFEDASGSMLSGSSIDYNVKINKTIHNFNFEENGTTDKGTDIKIIRGIPSPIGRNPLGNYSVVIDILTLNNNPIYEETRPFSVNLTR